MSCCVCMMYLFTLLKFTSCFPKWKLLNKPLWPQIMAFSQATQHKKFVCDNQSLPKWICPAALWVSFWPQIMAICRRWSLSYKIFVPDDAGFIACCGRQAVWYWSRCQYATYMDSFSETIKSIYCTRYWWWLHACAHYIIWPSYKEAKLAKTFIPKIPTGLGLIVIAIRSHHCTGIPWDSQAHAHNQCFWRAKSGLQL